MPETPVLSIRDLKTYFFHGQDPIKAVDGVSLDVYKGRITAIVGGSGAGKSVLALSVFNLLDKPGAIVGGEVILNGVNLRSLSETAMCRVRGREMAMVFQEPSASLNPTLTVRRHFREVLRAHAKSSAVKEAALFHDALLRVGLPGAETILSSYPFELSGGMCQRVMLAMGVLARADVLIADEPTSSLDLTTQAAILRELQRLRDEGMAIVLITHDLGVVAQAADDVHVMLDGKIVDSGSVFDVFETPKHPYTESLLASVLDTAAL